MTEVIIVSLRRMFSLSISLQPVIGISHTHSVYHHILFRIHKGRSVCWFPHWLCGRPLHWELLSSKARHGTPKTATLGQAVWTGWKWGGHAR